MRLLVMILAALSLAAPAGATTHYVSTTSQFQTAVERIGNRAGTIVLRPGRYGGLSIADRLSTRWLTVRSQPGAQTRYIAVARASHVSLVGTRIVPYWGQPARLFVSGAHQVRLSGATVRGAHGLPAGVHIRSSSGVTVRGSDFSRCGEGRVCANVFWGSSRVTLGGNAFHDCYGCDFVHAIGTSGLTLRLNTFDRALPGPCGVGGACNHQDLVQLFGGRAWLIERNRFGVYRAGAAQLYISGQHPTHGVTVRSNVFLRSDPAVPGVKAVSGIIVGNPPGYNGLPTGVVVAGNTVLSGAERVTQRDWKGVANSVIISQAYARLPPEQRPILVNNLLARTSHPEYLCAGAQASGYNLFREGSPCSELDLAGDPLVDEGGFPTDGASPLVGRADPHWATPVDASGYPRDDQPDIGAYEWR
jgi:hypothetical protein